MKHIKSAAVVAAPLAQLTFQPHGLRGMFAYASVNYRFR